MEYTTRNMLIALEFEYNFDWDKICHHINKKLPFDEKLLDRIENVNTDKFITIIDEDYPEKEKTSYKPPFVVMKVGKKGRYITDKQINETIKK